LGGKRVTSQDVAKEAGVSRTTVSLVLNNVKGIKISPATRQKVMDAAERLSYVPNAAARALASQRAQIIGLLLSRKSHHISTDAFINPIMQGLLDVFRQHDMCLLIDIVDPDHTKEAYIQLARAKRIDGILFSGPRLDDEALKLLEMDGFPTVLIGQLPDTKLCMVDIDNCAAAKSAVAHLIRLGHRQIACITNAQLTYSAAVERLRGYQCALEEAGIAYDPALVRYGDFTIESGYEEMCSLLAGQAKFTAAFVASDTLALGARAALGEHGLSVPQDVALVGFDDLPFARYMDPPLTTVHLPVSDLARRASEVMIALLSGDPIPCDRIILDTELIIRESCGVSYASTSLQG
jgi:LacI family transcriptional regulator